MKGGVGIGWVGSGLVHQFGLPLKRKLKHLSRGMRMKAALASVLAYRPALIVLDEPFSGLDAINFRSGCAVWSDAKNKHHG